MQYFPEAFSPIQWWTLVQEPHYISAPLGSVKLFSTEAFHARYPEE